MLYWEFTGADTACTDTSNTSRTLSIHLTNDSRIWLFTAGIGDTNYGNVVGTGDTAVQVTDYALQTLIAHGTSAGQLQYSAVTFGAPATDATGTSFVVTRVFTNGTGGDVTVKEIGLNAYWSPDTPIYYFLIARDILSPAITLANGEALTVNYTFATTV
jgi:hypothetical protein